MKWDINLHISFGTATLYLNKNDHVHSYYSHYSWACRYLDADYYRRRRVEKENDGMNFIESVI